MSGRQRRAGAAASACMLLSATAGVLGVDGTPTWIQSRVRDVTPGFFVSTPAMAFDHYGSPSISWSQVQPAATNSVYHSQFLSSGLWSHRQLASGTGVGLATALSFDRAERPTIVWSNDDGAVLADFNGGGPQAIVSFGADAVNPVLSLSHDLAGDLRGMFAGETPGDFFDISYSGGAFSSGPLTTIGGLSTVMDAALVTDHRGLRHLATRAVLTAGGEAVVIASEPPAGGAWPSLALATADAAQGVDIAVDPTDGNIALAYTMFDTATSTSALFYSKFDGFSMQTTVIATSSVDSFEDVSLAFDFSDGRPAIAYEHRVVTPSAEELVFAYMDGTGLWQTSLVDASISLETPGAMLRRPSLAFDDFGTSWPAIAYVDADGGLNVAFDPPVPEPGVVGLVCVGVGVLVGRRRYVYPRR